MNKENKIKEEMEKFSKENKDCTDVLLSKKKLTEQNLKDLHNHIVNLMKIDNPDLKHSDIWEDDV